MNYSDLPVYASETEMAKMAGFSPAYLKNLRRGNQKRGIRPELHEGVYWFRASERGIRYEVLLVLDFFRNRYNQEAHRSTVKAHLQSLRRQQPSLSDE